MPKTEDNFKNLGQLIMRIFFFNLYGMCSFRSRSFSLFFWFSRLSEVSVRGNAQVELFPHFGGR